MLTVAAIGVGGYIIQEFFGGPLGSFGSAAVSCTLRYLFEDDPAPRWPLLIPLVLALVGAIVLLIILRRTYTYARRMQELADLQGKMLGSMAGSISTGQELATIETSLKEFLRESMDVLNKHVRRALIMRPDPADSECLVMWVAPYHSPTSVERTRLRISRSSDSEMHPDCGVAGASYIDGHMRLARMVKEGNEEKFRVYKLRYLSEERRWVKEVDAAITYRKFSGTERTRTYESFVTIPVGSNRATRLGVLCYEGKIPEAFNDPGEFEILFALAAHLDATVTLYKHLLL
ncbi:MAG TPA: hypothetical protein VF914_16330 [Chloroflexia bacterium]|jgi:hypothetical protein